MMMKQKTQKRSLGPGHDNRYHKIVFSLLLILICICFFGNPGYCAPLFSAQSFVLEDRTLAVIPADIDNKGPEEIIVVKKTGIYPNEKRWICIFKADHTMKYIEAPQQQWEIDKEATMFEVGDVAPSSGKEIFFLTARGIRYYAQEYEGVFSTVSKPLLTLPTATVFPAPSFLPRVRLLADWRHNGQNTLLLPQFDAFVFFDQNKSGDWQVSERIKFAPRTYLYSDQKDDGILRSYSLRTDYRLPNIFVANFNGDGQTDLLLTEQELIMVYTQQSDGHFTQNMAGQVVMPGRTAEKENNLDISFLAIPADVNKDNFADVILSTSSNTDKFLERKMDVSLFLNRKIKDKPFVSQPDQKITFYGITPGIRIKDINKDGRQDLIFSHIQLGFWNTVKNLVSKSVDVHTSVYLLQDNQRFPAEPDFYQKTKYQLDLTRGVEFKGIWPSMDGDFNKDGYPDLLIARDDQITIYPTARGKMLFSNSLHQFNVKTFCYKHISDLNRDGRDDLIFYERKRDARLSILLNNGKL
ncbi:MAG: VCBS repeat-containing protein [Desulfobacteraceae bacterium]|nr:VCBS repeat-containing protein [Desulfobacteraceae bacterium]